MNGQEIKGGGVIERGWRGQQTGQKINHRLITRSPGEEIPGSVNKEHVIWEVSMHHIQHNSFYVGNIALTLKFFIIF